MRLYAFGLDDLEKIADITDDGVKCPSCGWRTTVLYVIAESRDEAEKMIREGDAGICGGCMAELLTTENYKVMPNGVNSQ